MVHMGPGRMVGGGSKEGVEVAWVWQRVGEFVYHVNNHNFGPIGTWGVAWGFVGVGWWAEWCWEEEEGVGEEEEVSGAKKLAIEGIRSAGSEVRM